jgi:hypothetical protein
MGRLGAGGWQPQLKAPRPHLLHRHPEERGHLDVGQPRERLELVSGHQQLAGVPLRPGLVEGPLPQAGVELERMQRQRTREAHERIRLIPLGQRLERRMHVNSVGLREGERPAAVEDELHARLSRERPTLPPVGDVHARHHARRTDAGPAR